MPSFERTNMSDDGDRVCPLCAEEMDLTDQQLKPCKCGYEICVWCWHHIMEMAEKDETEGRCPACRTPYDKQRIIGMTTNCERLAAVISAEKRQKFQKAKLKTSAETRKQLSTVRVIQRNLVYIMGLPANLCDENLLERKEYFGQYGKVLKVSISRSANTANQQASNSNTVGVYITYAREEEAVRCIQAVHNYMLDGKPLRACFGTNKYCHAWLRNMNCTNPDCLYLHDISAQDDSFTKDEIISAYTRSRVSETSSHSLQRRGGSVLPPADELASNGTSTSKHPVKNASNITSTGQSKVSNASVARPTVLPAAASWGSRASNGRSCSQSSIKQNVESSTSLLAHSSFNSGTKQVSSGWHDDVHSPSEAEGRHVSMIDGILRVIEPHKAGVAKACQETMSDVLNVSLQSESCEPSISAWDDEPVKISKITEESNVSQAIGRAKVMSPPRCPTIDRDQETLGIDLSTDSVAVNLDKNSTSLCKSAPPFPNCKGTASIVSASLKKTNAENGIASKSFDNHSVFSGDSSLTSNNACVPAACLGLPSANIDMNNEQHRSSPPYACSSGLLKKQSCRSEQYNSVEEIENSVLTSAHLADISSIRQDLKDRFGCNLESEQQLYHSAGNRMEDPSPVFSDCRETLLDSSSQKSSPPNSDHSFSNLMGDSNSIVNDAALASHSSSHGNSIVHYGLKGVSSCRHNECNLADEQSECKLSNIYKPASSTDSNVKSSSEGFMYLDRFGSTVGSRKGADVHTGESNIISNILSLDFDLWEDSLSLSDSFSKLLGEDEGKIGSVMFSKPLSAQNSNQSRFSFARQESQESFVESSIEDVTYLQNRSSLKGSRVDNFQNGFIGNGFLDKGTFNSNTNIPDRPTGVSRAKLSAPPGFSLPIRPLPGFSVQDHYDQNIDASSGNHLHGNSLSGNHFQVHSTNNSGDLDFIDPAILAVGKGCMLTGSSNVSFGLSSAFPAQFISEKCDPRLELMMQQSVSSHQIMRTPDYVRESFLPANNSYDMSHLLAQNHGSLSPLAQLSIQQSRNSPISSAHWDGWNYMQSSAAGGTTKYLRNDRFGLNNYYPVNGEYKLHLPSSTDIYSRAFGM